MLPNVTRRYNTTCIGTMLHLLYNLDSSIILSESTSAFPPWRIHKLSVCTELFSLSKRDTPGNTLRDDHITAHTISFCIFTDGSKTADRVGYALFSSRGSSQCRLTNAASIYTAELYAIRDVIEYSATHAAEYETITIHSHSRSAIQALSSPSQQNPLIQQIQDTIIMSTKSFTLCWVPSHVGVEGNERADELAKTSIHLPITPPVHPKIQLQKPTQTPCTINLAEFLAPHTG